MGTSLFFATPRTKDAERRPCPTNTHVHFIFFQLSWTSLATDIFLWSSSHYFFVFFFLPLDTNWLRGESNFRPEPHRKPPCEPSRVDIQFYYNLKKIYTDIPLVLPKMIKYSFYEVSTMFSNPNGTMEIDILSRAKTRQTRNQDAAHAHKRVTAPLIIILIIIVPNWFLSIAFFLHRLFYESQFSTKVTSRLYTSQFKPKAPDPRDIVRE